MRAAGARARHACRAHALVAVHSPHDILIDGGLTCSRRLTRMRGFPRCVQVIDLSIT